MSSADGPGRRSDGERTHAAILEAAVRLASMEGLTSLTVGRLAQELGISKSGLYAHFGSKEQLQLETIAAAQAVIHHEVMRPTMAAPEGLARLQALCESYLSYVERLVFPGGCFFASLLAEMDARPGPVRDVVIELERSWIGRLTQLIRDAQRLDELSPELDPAQLAFEIDACLELTNYHYVLFGEPAIIERGQRAIRHALQRSRAPAVSRERQPRAKTKI